MRLLLSMVSGAALATGFGGAFWVTSLALDRQPPIRYYGASAIARSVPQGGSIEVEFDVFRDRICRADTKRWLTDAEGTRHSIPQFTVGLSPDVGREIYRRTITIPEAAAVGMASYQVDVAFSCNIFHRIGWPISVSSPPIRFEVTPSVSLTPFGLVPEPQQP